MNRFQKCRSLRGRGLCAAAILIAFFAAAGSAGAAQQDHGRTLVLKARRIHTAAGPAIENGILIIRDGKIQALGANIAIPEDAKVIDVTDGVITPGLIDANCMVDFELPEVAGEQYYATRLPGALRNPAPAMTLATALDDAHVAARDKPRLAPAGPIHKPANPWTGLTDVLQESQAGYEHDACAGICGGPSSAAAVQEALAAGPSANATWAEQSSEVVPHCRVLDSVNLFSNDFRRLLKSGVTTVFVAPDSASVIGARGAIVKTGGPLGSRVVRAADAAKATIGSDPSRRGQSNSLPPTYGSIPTVFTRRPTTRMGVEFVFRKAFYDALRTRDGIALHGADQPPESAIPTLLEILDGKVPLRIQARMQHDIFTALRLASEFKLKFTLEEATEAYQCLDELSAADIPVIFGPIYMTAEGFRASTGEVGDPRLNTPRQLLDRKVRFALSAQELRDEEGLARQGMYAVRYGLPADEALRAITAAPAELLGLKGQVGTLGPGAVADVVVWTGEPLDATSRAKLVLIDGRVVYEE